MTLLQAIILGTIQGITEFFPVSSSGHLILLPKILGWDIQSLSFDAFIHLGTVSAILVYFRKDLSDLVRAARSDVRKILSSRFRVIIFSKKLKFLILLILGAIPVGILGLFLENFIEKNIRNEYFVLSFLFFVSFYFILAERLFNSSSRKVSILGKEVGGRPRTEIRPVDAIIIGVAQAFAIFPGVSRSGFTISTALMQNLERDLAIKFSFLLSIPAVLAAGIYKFGKVLGSGLDASQFGYYLVGGLVSFIVGFLSISFLIKFLRSNTLIPFAVYRIALVIFLISILY